MNEGRYQVTLSHYGHEISQESFTSFPEALARAIKLRAEWKDSRAHFVRLENTDKADIALIEGYFDGLTQEERDQWDEHR